MRRCFVEVVAVAKSCMQCTALLCSTPLTSSAQSSESTKPLVLVYARDPVQTPRPELLELPWMPLATASGPGLRHPWLAAYSCIDSGELDSARGVRVCSLTASASPDAQGRFAAQPLPADAPAQAADPFAEQMLFYHAARSLQFFAALGLAATDASAKLHLIANVRLPGPDALAPWRDASFIRAHDAAGMLAAMEQQEGPTIYFGQDHEVRVAYDSAAIRHEVSHAVLAPWLPAAAWIVDAHGTNNAPAAIAEALADYFAAAMVDEPRLGVHASHGSDEWKIRNLNTQLTCPAALSGSAHEDGLVIASALWALRKQLGAMLDAAVISAIEAPQAAAELASGRFLKGLLEALATKQPASARAARAVFRERGLLPSCLRMLELQPGQSLSGAAGKFILPGTEPLLPLASSVLQLRAAVPRGATEVELRMRSGTLPAFLPALLVKASPIRWTPAAAHDAALMAVAVSGAPGELRFVVPTAGARTLYFQVVNQGQRAGWFDAVRITFRP